MSGEGGETTRRLKSLLASLWISAFWVAGWASVPLSFEERVKAQEAIERVYYEHRIWPKENPQPKPPFEQMVPKAVIEAKVTDYLKKCAAVDRYWQRPIRPEQLQAEMARMARQTQDPATLRELFAALSDDPYLIAECLARPLLADRLLRNWYAYDTRFHGASKKEAEDLRAHLTPQNFKTLAGERYQEVRVQLEDEVGYPNAGAGPSQSEGSVLSPENFRACCADFPEPGCISGVTETAEAFLIRWTERKDGRDLAGGTVTFEKCDSATWLGAQALSPRGLEPSLAATYSLPKAGTRDDPVSPDAWRERTPLSVGYSGTAAIWTGTEMIVWGGIERSGRYDPSTDTWSPVFAGVGCPLLSGGSTAVWTGTRMIVWGGTNSSGSLRNLGGIYDPAADEWLPTSTGANCPSARKGHTAVWTGTEMVVWGGASNTGGRYNPSTDTWAATSTGGGCPSSRTGHTAIWAGTEMVVWGGDAGGYSNTGGRYNPSSDTWVATSAGTGCPTGRYGHTAVWTGKEMIVWGGKFSDNWPYYADTGGRYDPVEDSWLAATSTAEGCPSLRGSHTAVWTGSEMIVWGGYDGYSTFDTGGRYNAAADTWTATSSGSGCPAARSGHTAVWAKSEMIIWGGGVSTGGRYDPIVDSWVVASAGTGPYIPPFASSVAVWTGSEMIVQGAAAYSRYSPSTDVWAPTSSYSYCLASSPTAIWTGTEMIVWGGFVSAPEAYGQLCGKRYNPAADTWRSTTTNGLSWSFGRGNHTAVWTGTEMIIWGGSYRHMGGTPPPYVGGRYDPQSNSWILVSAEYSRIWHTAVWAGNEMIVWGGHDNVYSYLNTGGRYDPSTNAWTPTSTGANCPSARTGHRALWTGTEMIVWGSGNTGGRYTPSSDTWAATSTGTDCPSERGGPSAVWTGTEMIVWGGVHNDGESHYLNTGGRYRPATDSWVATPAEPPCPSGRAGHPSVWTGEEMIIWGGSREGTSGPLEFGIFYPNTPPRSVPVLSTSSGTDAVFTLGSGETLNLNGTASTDGSNPFTTTPFHDKLDSVVSYEWDLNGDALFGTQCDTASEGVDATGATPPALTEGDLAALGITSPGPHAIWLRVTDEVGVRHCAPVVLYLAAEGSAPGEASRQSAPADALRATWDGVAGQVHATYTPACGATGHAAYWGDLAQVSGYTWSGSQCVLGSSEIVFAPPPGDIFFVVVGRDGAHEGSYGKDSAGSPRPEATGIGACDYPQSWETCDP